MTHKQIIQYYPLLQDQLCVFSLASHRKCCTNLSLRQVCPGDDAELSPFLTIQTARTPTYPICRNRHNLDICQYNCTYLISTCEKSSLLATAWSQIMVFKCYHSRFCIISNERNQHYCTESSQTTGEQVEPLHICDELKQDSKTSTDNSNFQPL